MDERLEYVEESASRADVIVLDVLMPNLDGLTTCRAIRMRSQVPTLLLTARQEVNERVRASTPARMTTLRSRSRSLSYEALEHLLRPASEPLWAFQLLDPAAR